MHNHNDIIFTYILGWLQDIDLVPSHVVPSLTVDKEHNDVYSAYNKPGAVMYWLRVRPISSLHVSWQHLFHQGQSCLAQSRLQQLEAFLHVVQALHTLHTLSCHPSQAADMHKLCLDSCVMPCRYRLPIAECCNIRTPLPPVHYSLRQQDHWTPILQCQLCLTPSLAAKAR